MIAQMRITVETIDELRAHGQRRIADEYEERGIVAHVSIESDVARAFALRFKKGGYIFENGSRPLFDRFKRFINGAI